MVRLRAARRLPKAAWRVLARYRGKPCTTAADADRLWKAFSKLQAYQVLREALKRNSGGRCAYCELPRPGTVDHFRPRRYRRSLFALGNLLPCCSVCQGHKLAYFPLLDRKGLLLNPYLARDDPALFLAYDDLGTVLPRGPGQTWVRADTTIRTLGLDKAWELARARGETWERFLSCCVDYNAQPSPAAAQDMACVLTSIYYHRGVLRFMLESVPEVEQAAAHARQHHPDVGAVLSRPPYAWP
jgi:uncharacterized protein (TIGR02646 family)